MELWSLILLNPILNLLIALSGGLAHSFGLAIIVLTIIVRLAMLPLNMKQLRASRAMAEGMRQLQPKLQQLQKKYAKDRQKLSQETMKLYKEVGMSPMGCISSPMLIPMIVQFPIWIALYQSIIRALAVTPQDLLGLSQHLYSWSIVRQAMPVSGQFLWLNLANPDPYFLIPLLVMATMWISQKMITMPAVDPKQQSMNSMMQLMMPLMFGLICFSLPSGLGLYWVISGIISILIQRPIYGFQNVLAPYRTKQTTPEGRAIVPGRRKPPLPAASRQASKEEESIQYGKSGSKRQDSGGSRPHRP